MAEGGDGQPPRRPFGALRSTFKAMSDWGDTFERQHCNGDFLGTISSASKTWQAMNAWGDDFERRHFNGDLLGTMDKALAGAILDPALNDALQHMPPELQEAALASASGGAVSSSASATPAMASTSQARSSSDPAVAVAAARDTFGDSAASAAGVPAYAPAPVLPAGLTAQVEPAAAGRGVVPAQAAAACAAAPVAAAPDADRGSGRGWFAARAPAPAPLAEATWEEAERLRAELARQRALRPEREERRRALDAALPPLRIGVVEEQQALAAADAARASAELRGNEVERALDELRARHHAALSKQAAQEAEILQHVHEARFAERALEEWKADEWCDGSREWARDGPETDALMLAKLELAEVLMLVDETRLQSRRELRALQEELTRLETEVAAARQEDNYVPPKSFKESLKYLFNVARGRD
eukprot:TRINITY_DN22071_c0_g1_i1.p1 TRINITY_DN22071_c0_g1~~TRINITY_DN22071_c0_g1_i1.p1  ORF type:complete len:420 (-),score=142.15 TRINITY_DN22071_c0_g1_i1:54-1313(-)